MRIVPEHPDYDKYAVYLDSRLVRTAVAADDEEGWVEIVDLAAMAPLDLESDEEVVAGKEEDLEPTEIKTRRLTGLVELVRIAP